MNGCRAHERWDSVAGMERSERPEDMVGEPLPDLSLPDAHGRPYPLRQHLGHGSLVLFFIIRNGTPG